MMAHGHLDLFGAEPGWSSIEDTHIGPVPDMDFDDDEQTGLYVVVEAGAPDDTIICAAPPPPPEPRFRCGMTRHEHDEIKLDAFRRETELEDIGQIHDEDLGVHLQLANHSCGTTVAYPLPGHRASGVRR
jgi:hypothetical protein